MQKIDCGIFSIAYLPPVSYVAQIMCCAKIVFEINEFYIKQTYRNRCKILTANGIMDLSVPVEKPNGTKTTVKNIRIANNENWQTIHWRAMEAAYNKSPFFEFYKDDFLPFFTEKYNFLFDFNLKLLQKIFELLEIDFYEFSLTDKYFEIKENEFDFRSAFNSKTTKTLHYSPYYQVFTERNGFVSNLSIIDLLFNLGNEAAGYLKKITML